MQGSAAGAGTVLKGFHDVPGSHRLGPIAETGESNSLPDYPLARAVPVPAEAGDVLLFNYLTIHGSGVKRSERPRLNVLFHPGRAEIRSRLPA